MDTIITDEILNRLIGVMRYSHLWGYSYVRVYFDNEEYEIFPKNSDSVTNIKNIFRNRSLLEVKNALSDTGFFDVKDFFFSTIITILDERSKNSFLMIDSLSKKIDDLSDKVNILVDVITLNQKMSDIKQ